MKRNDFLLSEESQQQPWSYGCGIADIQEGKVAEEEVHGCVKMRVNPDEDDHSEIPHQSGDVDEEENHKEQLLHGGEAQEDKLCHARVVSPCHAPGASSYWEKKLQLLSMGRSQHHSTATCLPLSSL